MADTENPSLSDGEITNTDPLTIDIQSLDTSTVENPSLTASQDDGPYEHLSPTDFLESQFEVATASPPCGFIDLITHPVSNVSINRLYQPQHSPLALRSPRLSKLSKLRSHLRSQLTIEEEDGEEIPITNFDKIKRALKPTTRYLPAKFSYFLYFSGLSLINTFFTIFLVNLGLDPEQAGLIQVARSATMIGSSLFWGWLAHKTRRNMLIICVELLVSTTLVNLMPWVANNMVDTESAIAHKAHIDDSFKDSLNITLEQISAATTNEEMQKIFGLDFKASHYRTASPYLFGAMFALSVGFTFFIGGALLLIETRVYNMTKSNSNGKNLYGHQRLWGSLSFAVTPLIAGAIMEAMPKYLSIERDPIQVVFYMYMVIMIGSVVSCAFLFRKDGEDKLATATGGASEMYSIQEAAGQWKPVEKVLKKTFTSMNNIMLFVNIFFLGLVYGIQWNFQFIFMQEVGASKTMMGLCVTIQLLVEAIVYPFAMNLIALLRGNKFVTTITCFTYALLFFTFSVTNSPYLMVIPAGFLGFSFTLFHNANMEELHRIGGTRFLTILQTLYHVIFTGVGCSVSGVAGGIIYNKYGGRVLFFMSGSIMAAFSIFNGVNAFLYRRCAGISKYGKEEEEVEEEEEGGVMKAAQEVNSNSDYDEGIWDVL